MNDIIIKLHWSDKPYKWHINDGDEAFMALDRKEQSSILNVGDIFYAYVGNEYVVHPIREAIILVIEKEGSI